MAKWHSFGGTIGAKGLLIQAFGQRFIFYSNIQENAAVAAVIQGNDWTWLPGRSEAKAELQTTICVIIFPCSEQVSLAQTVTGPLDTFQKTCFTALSAVLKRLHQQTKERYIQEEA
jgi:hypothetical protein